MSKSKFASTLKELVDGTNIYSRSQWAQLLGTPEDSINQWLNDEDIPGPVNLRSLWSLLLEDTRVSNKPLQGFNDLMHEPAENISPYGFKMKPTVAHYIIKPVRDGALRLLDTLPPHIQEKAWLEFTNICRNLRSSMETTPSVVDQRYEIFDAQINKLAKNT